VASLSQGRTAAAQCGLFTYKSVPVIFEPPCIFKRNGGRKALSCRLSPQCPNNWPVLLNTRSHYHSVSSRFVVSERRNARKWWYWKENGRRVL